MVRAEQIGVEPTETSESLRDNLSNRLVLHVALGQFDADVKPEKGKPIKIHENSLTALKNQNTAVREIDAEAFGERYKREKLTEGKKEEEITKDEIRDAQFLTWAKYASEEIIRGFQKDVALKIYVELGLIKDTTRKPQAEEVMKMFYDTTSQKPGEFYNNFCGTNMNKALAEKLTTDDMLIIKSFLVKWMVGSEKAFNALLVLRATQDRLAPTTPDAELIPQDQSVTGLEKQVLEFYREGWEMEDSTQQTQTNANNNDTTTQQAPARPDNTPKQKPPEPLPEATRNPNKQEPTQEQRKKIDEMLQVEENRKKLLTKEYEKDLENLIRLQGKATVRGHAISDQTPLFIELQKGERLYVAQRFMLDTDNVLVINVVDPQTQAKQSYRWENIVGNIRRVITGQGELVDQNGIVEKINNETIFDRDQYILDHLDLFSQNKTPEPTSQSSEQPSSQDTETDRVVNEVKEHIKNNRLPPDNALAYVNTKIGQYTGKPNIQSQLYVEKGKFARFADPKHPMEVPAYNAFNAAINLNPNNAEAYIEYAYLLIDGGKFGKKPNIQEAEDLLKKAKDNGVQFDQSVITDIDDRINSKRQQQP